MINKPEHLGDGVYVNFDGYNIEVRVNDHRNEPVVYLEPQVVKALKRYIQRVEEHELPNKLKP